MGENLAKTEESQVNALEPRPISNWHVPRIRLVGEQREKWRAKNKGRGVGSPLARLAILPLAFRDTNPERLEQANIEGTDTPNFRSGEAGI